MTLITIFGTCRQHPIKKMFNCTSIQEDLTYAQYSKEILQAIKFCKGNENLITPEMTRYCFRAGILNKTQVSNVNFIDQFNATDLFVIEIASMKSFEYNVITFIVLQRSLHGKKTQT
jgi:hypothetical protein